LQPSLDIVEVVEVWFNNRRNNECLYLCRLLHWIYYSPGFYFNSSCTKM